MTFVEILDVALSEVDTEQLGGRKIEAPKPQSRIDGDSILIVGWVLARSNPATTVEIVHDGTVLKSVPIDVLRPDVAAAFPNASEAEQSGFRTNVPIPDSEEFELLVQVVLQDGETGSLGVVRARQRRDDEVTKGESSSQGRSKPLMRERPEESRGFFRRLFSRGGG